MRLKVLRLMLTVGLLFPLAKVEAQQGKAESLTQQHIEKVLQKAPNFIEQYGETLKQRVPRDANSNTIRGHIAPRHHPWKDTGAPESGVLYYTDSLFNLDSRPFNVSNWSQAWSCFEPKLLAKARHGREVVYVAGPGNEDLIAECRSKCVSRLDIPYPRGSIPGMIAYDAMGCFEDSDDWGYLENGYEVVEFWYPEYQIEINNYGINRITPAMLSPTGQLFMRQNLLSQKEQVEQQILRENERRQSYPLEHSDLKLPDDRNDPFIGQGVSTQMDVDKQYGHVIRTWLSTSEEEKKPPTTAGWEVKPDRSYLGAMPKRKSEKDPVVIWNEFGLFDVITSVPHMSRRIRPDLMQALYGGSEPYSDKARQEQGFYQSQGAAAYRAAKWPQVYGELSRVGIQGSNTSALKEAVFRGGYELFPLVTNTAGFTSPALSSAAIIARRMLYLAGARAPREKGGDASGMIESAFPQGAERGRMITYTINSEDKSREIDKMQLISPKRPKGASQYGGIPPMVSECFRSQNIPNFINDDRKLQQWADRNLPHDLVGYFSDLDAFSAQGGAIVFTYWNRRIGCFCDRCGLPTGSSTIINGGDGDKLYDKPRKEYCRYPVMTGWSAWAKRDTFSECRANGKNESFYDGTGLDDKV